MYSRSLQTREASDIDSGAFKILKLSKKLGWVFK